MKIGIFGGSFNPPHNIHKKIAIELIQKKYVDKVIYVPTGDNYNKPYLVPAKDRYNMVNIMISNDEALDIDDFELYDRKYTYETLDYFKNKYKDDDIYFICGSDNLNEITTWKNYKYILDKYKIIVINRNNDNIEEKYKNVIHVKLDTSNLSSTEIRSILETKNYNLLKSKIDKSVLKYIVDKNLY